jgi:hypothetical protein
VAVFWVFEVDEAVGFLHQSLSRFWIGRLLRQSRRKLSHRNRNRMQAKETRLGIQYPWEVYTCGGRGLRGCGFPRKKKKKKNPTFFCLKLAQLDSKHVFLSTITSKDCRKCLCNEVIHNISFGFFVAVLFFP